jgi:molybdate transport system substrate-binding protein
VRRTTTALLAVVVAMALLGAVACGDDANDIEDIRRADEAAATTAPTGPQLAGTLQVMATDPLTEPFDEIAAAFEQVHPQVTVEVDYGGSGLRDLVLADVPADVFATGDPADIEALTDGGALAGDPAAFAVDDRSNDYSVSVLSATADVELAEAFVVFVLSGRSQGILESHGFTAPAGSGG